MTEPIVCGFSEESAKLNADTLLRRANERSEVIDRAYIAKELSIELRRELENKYAFLQQMFIFDKRSAVMYYESALKMNVLESRLKV